MKWMIEEARSFQPKSSVTIGRCLLMGCGRKCRGGSSDPDSHIQKSVSPLYEN